MVRINPYFNKRENFKSQHFETPPNFMGQHWNKKKASVHIKAMIADQLLRFGSNAYHMHIICIRIIFLIQFF